MSSNLIKARTCPYCLTELEYSQVSTTRTCTNNECEQELPSQYIQKEAKPLFVQIIGSTNVGKTTYLQALTLMLMRANKFLGADYAYSPLTPLTREYVQHVRQFLEEGEVPDATSGGRHSPYMMHLLKINDYKNQKETRDLTLVISDFAGENFEDFYFSLEYAPYIMHETTLLMIGLDELENAKITMDDLMSSYIETIVRNNNKKSQKPHKVIIVLSKADLIFDELPSYLQSYLQDDRILKLIDSYQSVKDAPKSVKDAPEPVKGTPNPVKDDSQSVKYELESLESYYQIMDTKNQEIKKWIVKKYPSARNLVALASANDIDLRFTIVSSIGIEYMTNPVHSLDEYNNNNEIKRKPKPVRVLDPFLWLLEVDNTPTPVTENSHHNGNSNDENKSLNLWEQIKKWFYQKKENYSLKETRSIDYYNYKTEYR